MFEVFVLAIALSMDAFAVSIGLGSKKVVNAEKLFIKAAAYFGFFQGFMPLLGYYSGKGLSSWIEDYAPWIAFILLVFIGGKMIYESQSEGIEEDIANVTHRVLFVLAIATSIDAMAAGYAITLLEVDIAVACLIIGVTTFAFSWIGVNIGERRGVWLESKAELFGGLVLIAIAFKILLG